MKSQQLRWAATAAFLFLILPPSLVWAQTGEVTGTVTDAETGESLPGASVLLVEQAVGAATDVDGTFTIGNVPEGEHTLQVSFVGFLEHEESIEVAAGETVDVSVALEPDIAGLEEIVVTGLGIQRERGRAQVAVSRVDATQLTEQASYQDITQLISGNVPGVNVQAASGNIGGGMRFNVRAGGGLGGDGQPAIYLDGTRIDNAEIAGFGGGGQGVSTLADLNPEDIASIDVIRGPAGAAIYGTEGASGVVLITTRRGDFAAEPTFNVRYRGTAGINEQAEPFDPQFYDRADLTNSLFRVGSLQGHNVSATGSTDLVSYYASIDNRYEEGHLPRNDGNRTNLRANFEAHPTERVTLQANAGYTLNRMNRPENDNTIQGSIGEALLGPVPFFITDSLAIFNIDDVQRVNRFIGSMTASYSPLANLRIRATAGYDSSTRRQDRTRPVGFAYPGIGTAGERNFYTRINNQFNADIQAQYTYTLFDGLDATSLVGGQFLDRSLRTGYGTAQGFASDQIANIGAGDDFTTLEEEFINRRTGGLFAAQELTLHNTYFVSAALRRDVASELGEGISHVFYPSISASVRLDQFEFVPEFFTMLSPRVAYGETGELPDLLDGQLVRFGAISSGYGGAAIVGSVGDPTIVPERVREIEFGVDADILDRVSVEATFYRAFANNSIIYFQAAPSTGFGFSGLAIPRNVGGIDTQGFELGLGLTPIWTEQARLDVDLNYAYQQSEVTDLGGAPPLFDGFDVNVMAEGLPRSAFYTWEVTGADVAPDGTVTPIVSDDRVHLGNPIPNHTGGIRLNLNLFQNLNISGFAEYALGHQVFNNTLRFAAFDGTHAERNRQIEQLAELEPGTDAFQEAAEAFVRTHPSYQGNFIEDADWLKVREVSVRYDFTSVLHRAGATGFNEVRLGLSARNLATFTTYSGPDPEINFDGGRSTSRGQDFLTLPTPRQLYMTVTVGF